MDNSTVPVPVADPAFEHKRSRRLATLDLVVHEFEHVRTGAMHYHLEMEHDENVFMVAFRTVPMDSTGVAHILEHTALCGSERYPVRDPFFWMIRRSLNTFMNAFTTSDYTAYPFASQNRKDFMNLLDVYLDAVFFPTLDPLDFAQEGHRIEFESPEDPDTPLVYRGVVYNEMKGDASSPISVLYEELHKHLYPETTYHYNSGGDPDHIPALRHDDLVRFHRTHYHPGNAVFMTFGNLPAETLQREFETRALSRFERAEGRIEVSAERRYDRPLSVSAPYGVDDRNGLAGRTHIVIGWLLGENTDLEMLLKCNLLSDVLLDTSASPLRQALELTPLAGAVSPLCGLEETSHEMSFVCGVEGSEPEHAAAIESLVMETLERVARDGIPLDKLEACLHQLELNQREIGGDGAPFGLQLIFSCMSAAIHRGDPIELLDLEPVLAKLRDEITDPDFIKSQVRDLLLNNRHRVCLTLYPDAELDERRLRQERERLDEIRAGLTADRIREIVARAKALAARQDAEEDISVLPKVGLDDVPHGLKVPEARNERLPNDMPLTLYEAGTNGLVYHQVVSPLPSFPPETLTVLPIYTNIVSEIGSGGLGYLETQHRQHSLTGGINCHAAFRSHTGDPARPLGWLTFSTRTLCPKTAPMAALLRQTIEAPDLHERSRIRDLVKQMRVRREANVTGNGHALAMSAAAARFRPVSSLHHELTGLAGTDRLKQLDDALGDDAALDELAARLESLRESLDVPGRRLLLICEPGFHQSAMELIAGAWCDARGSAGDDDIDVPSPFAPVPMDQAWLTTTQVNFSAAAWPTVPETHPDSAALSVLAGVLRNGFLHKVLRERGGAYGGGATHDSGNGVFRFYSYRDPNLMKTFDAFDNAVAWVLSNDIAFDLVEESILSIVSSIDAPASPAGEAKQAYHHDLFGRTPDHRRKVRENVLAVTVEDIKRVAGTWLQGECARATITSEARAAELPGSFAARTL